MNRITIITLGVQDLVRSHAFYDSIGWKQALVRPGLIFFPAAGFNLCLYPKDDLAAELGCTTADLGTGNSILTVNWDSREHVSLAFNHATDCGGTAIRLPAEMPWGGFSGYWSDPDGNVWEYAMDPTLTLSTDGQLDRHVTP